MPTRITNLEGTALEAVQTLAESIFLDGECYAYAIGLKRGLGWPLVGLIDGKGEIRHAMAYGVEDHKLYDVRGGFAQDDPKLGEPFGLRPSYDQRSIKETDLTAVRPVHEHTISRARSFAEITWPRLPWKGGYQQRLVAFLNELEALSRKHKLWIRAPLPTTASWPHLSPEGGEEAGYTLYPTEDGLGYIFDRRLGFHEH